MSQMQINHYPRSIFEDSWKSEHTIVRDLTDSISQQLPLTPEFIERLRNYPHVLAPFVIRGLIPQPVLHKILDTHDRIFRLLIVEYDKLKKLLEPHVVENLETLERLVATFKEAEEYDVEMRPLNESCENYYEALQLDPNRFLRLCDNPDEVLPALLAEAQAKILTSPAHAYFVVAHGNPSLVPNELLDVILGDQEYACRLLVECGDKLTEDQRSSVESSITEPKWVFHVLKNSNTPLLYRETLEERLLDDVPWMIEYLEHLRVSDFQRVLAIREKLSEPARKAGLVPELLQWQFRRFPKLHASRRAS